MTPLPGIWAKHLEAVLAETGLDQIVDLGSGSGGPAPVIVREIRKSGRQVKAILSDLYPDLHCRASDSELGVEYWPESVNAAQVPDALWGVRTMFASFHHCSPEVARGNLRNAFLNAAFCGFDNSCATCGLDHHSSCPSAVAVSTCLHVSGSGVASPGLLGCFCLAVADLHARRLARDDSGLNRR